MQRGREWTPAGAGTTAALAWLLAAVSAGASLMCMSVDPEAGRAAVLLDALAADARPWLARDPALLATKYDRMEGDLFYYMRGTAAVFYADAARPDPDRAPTTFLAVPEAAAVLLVGDPHPENFGTVLAGEGPGPETLAPGAAAPLTLEWVDLDGAEFGPYLLDVRRAALGIEAFASGIGGCTEACRTGAAEALARGYADEVARRAAGVPGWDAGVRRPGEGAFVARLWIRATEDGVERHRLLRDAAPGPDGTNALVRAPALDATGAGNLALAPEERAQIARLMAAYAVAAPPGFRVLDAVRRFGAGVASLPAVRYVVLWDRGGAGPEDDDLLNVREVIDPPVAAGLASPVPGLFASGAARVVGAARLLWSRADADVRTAALSDGVQTFKVTSWSSWFQELDHVEAAALWADGRAGEADLNALGDTLGRALAAAHAHARTAGGGAALGAIRAALAHGNEGAVDADGFAAERAAEAYDDLARLVEDHALFVRLRAAHGPLLDAAAPREEAW